MRRNEALEKKVNELFIQLADQNNKQE